MRNTVRGKIAKRVVRSLILTIVALSVVNLIYMSRHVLDAQEEEILIQTELCAEKINNWILNMSETVETVAAVEAHTGIFDEKTSKDIMDQLVNDNSELILAYVGTEDRQMAMSGGKKFPAGVDVRERVWYKAAKETGDTVVINPYVSATRTTLMLMTVAAPIYIDDEFVGACGVDASIDTIVEYLENATAKEGSYAFLIDSEGNIVGHPNNDYNPKVGHKTNAVSVMPDIKPLLKNPGSGIVTATDYLGNKMIYATEEVGNTGWIIGVAYPRGEYIAYVNRGIAICLFVAVFCLFFAAADVTTAIKRILLPLESVNPVMEKILKGDFTKIITFSKEEDEIGQLQNKMAEMVRQLSDIVNEQKYVLGEMAEGNLMVEDMDEFPGEMNEIAVSVNSIKSTFNDIISDIQFSAINLESYAMGINETEDIEEMKAIFGELAAEADALMEKTSKFKTTMKPD